MKFFILLALALTAAGLNASDLEPRDPKTDPRDFSWIRTWAAVGDSFTAGIGSGMIWDDADNSYSCSRYDLSYVAILNNFFGPSVDTFNYLACSGDTSLDVYNQINTLPGSSQDLVVVSAGGNDLCLSTLINTCVLSSVTTASACQSAIDTSQSFIDSQLGLNIDQVIDAAVSKLNTNGILVYTLYAKYFNAVADAPCHFDEDWVFPGTAGGSSLLLTTDLRQRLNTLVDNTNANINQAVAAAQKRYPNTQILAADWEPWLDAVGGYFCEPGEKPDPSDPANKNVQFFKLDTTKRPPISSLMEEMTDNETAVARQPFGPDALDAHFGLFNSTLDPRDPVAPPCGKSYFGGLLPDSIGKIFHPNELGHLTIASFVSDTISVARAKVIGAKNPDCTATNDLTCFQDKGSKSYATAYGLYAQTQDFCNSVVKQIPPNTANWQYTKTYYDGSYDVADWKVQLQAGGTTVTFDQCQDAVNNILDGCDGNDPNNPMNWKFGGQLETETVVWFIQPTKQGRQMPPWKTPQSTCDAWYKVFFDSWDIYGGGYSSWDWGQQTILGNFSSCIGSTPSHWRFQYYDQPDENGNEWHAWGGAPIWIKNRCMGGVIAAAGGPSGVHCDGNG